jgi:hypothetical protein
MAQASLQIRRLIIRRFSCSFLSTPVMVTALPCPTRIWCGTALSRHWRNADRIGECERLSVEPDRRRVALLSTQRSAGLVIRVKEPESDTGNGVDKELLEKCSAVLTQSLNCRGLLISFRLAPPILKKEKRPFCRSSSTVEHRFRKAGVKGSNPFFGFFTSTSISWRAVLPGSDASADKPPAETAPSIAADTPRAPASAAVSCPSRIPS